MIRNGKMQEFVDNHIVPKFIVQIKQPIVEVEMAIC